MSKAISQYWEKQQRAETEAPKPDAPETIKAASYLDAPNIGQEGTVWRRLTQSPNRDLIPIEQDRMIEIAFWLWHTNPLAKWLIDLTVAFILADGLPYTAENEEVKEVLDGFWNDPLNRMPLYFPKHVGELRTFGELCFPAFTAKQTGRVHVGYIDPAQIRDVITDPENVRVVIGVLTKGWVGSVGGFDTSVEPKAYKTILPEEAEYVLSDKAKALRDQFTDGECFYWSINNVTNSPRGRSDLLVVADWLDVYEQFLYDYADKWPMLNAFVWDLTVSGGDKTEIQDQVKNFSKKSGSVFGHNEKITLTAMAPKLESVEAGEGARIFRNHILGSFGYPEHWYGGGGDVNRATASEMDMPSLKMLSLKQLVVKYMIEDMLSYQIRQARAARYLRVNDDECGFSVATPEMNTKDTSKLSAAAQQTATAIMTGEMQGWIDKDTAARMYASIMSYTGVDIDLDDIRAKLEEEAETKGYEDYKGMNKKPPLRAVDTGDGGKNAK